MGMRQQAAAPVAQQPTDHAAGDFESAFGGMLDEEPKAKTSQGYGDDDEEEDEDELEPREALEDPIDRLEEASKAAKEKWRMQKENKELKARLEKLEAEGKKGAVLDSENPLREITKLKKWSKDDIINKALEAMEDDGLTETEAKEEVKHLTEDEIYEKVMNRIKEDQAKAEEGKQVEGVIGNFKNSIKEFAVKNAERFPLIDGLGGLDGVYSMIEAKWHKDAEEGGDEYATKNMLSIEAASKKINDQLASSVKAALQSNHVRQFIQRLLKEEPRREQAEDSQLEDFFQSEEEQSTLTNKTVRKVTDPKDSRELTEEERFKSSFSYLLEN